MTRRDLQWKAFLGTALVAGVSAFLLWAAFPPRGEVYDVAFALAPMLALARLAKRPRVAAAGWGVFGFAFWFATLAWMPAITKNNGPWPLVLLGWIGLAGWCAAFFVLFGWLDARVWRRGTQNRLTRLALPFAEALLWAGVEWLRATIFGGFAWNFLGTALGAVPSLAAPARWAGVYGVSALVVLVNGVFATLLVRLWATMRRDEVSESRWVRMLETGLPLAFVLVALGFAPAAGSSGPAVPLKVALVQRNAPCCFTRGEAEDPLNAFDRLLAAASAARPDLVVLPESAMVEFGPLRSESARHAALFFSRRCGGAAVLGGGNWTTPEGHLWNAAGLYRFDEAATNDLALQVYGKQHLVPFGEFIPLDKVFPVFQKLSPIGESCWPGEPAVFALLAANRGAPCRVRVAPLICYEDTDPVLARRAARMGAQAIVLITNDSWFSHSHETVQHAAQAVMRALETGLPVIRAGNSGVTGVICPSGRTRWLADDAGRPLVDAQGSQLVEVPLVPKPALTPYVRLGDAPLVVLFAVVFLWTLAPARNRFPDSREQVAEVAHGV